MNNRNLCNEFVELIASNQQNMNIYVIVECTEQFTIDTKVKDVSMSVLLVNKTLPGLFLFLSKQDGLIYIFR